MKFEVNLSKKYFFILLGAILILAGAIYGYAQPNVFGHSGNEIAIDNDFCNIILGHDCGTDNFEADTNTDTQDLSISGNVVSLTNGGSVTLPSSGTSICTWGSLEYTPGATCTTTCRDGSPGVPISDRYRCQGSGSWVWETTASGCGPECGGG